MRKLLVVFLVGTAAQLVDGSLGMAYGVTSTTLLLSGGVAPVIASASVHLAEVGTTLASGLSHWRFGNVDWRTVRRIGVPGAIGAFLGAIVLSSVSTEAARPFMAVILLSLGGYVLIRFSFGGPFRPRGRRYVRGRYLAALGLVAGFVDASGGGGWGPVATPTLLSTGKMQPRTVVGSVDTSEFAVALAAGIGFLAGLGGAAVDLGVVAMLAAGGLVAAPVAAWLVRIFHPRVLGCSVGGLIVLTNLRTLLDPTEVASGVRLAVYLAVVAVWSVAVAASISKIRSERVAAGGSGVGPLGEPAGTA